MTWLDVLLLALPILGTASSTNVGNFTNRGTWLSHASSLVNVSVTGQWPGDDRQRRSGWSRISRSWTNVRNGLIWDWITQPPIPARAGLLLRSSVQIERRSAASRWARLLPGRRSAPAGTPPATRRGPLLRVAQWIGWIEPVKPAPKLLLLRRPQSRAAIHALTVRLVVAPGFPSELRSRLLRIPMQVDAPVIEPASDSIYIPTLRCRRR